MTLPTEPIGSIPRPQPLIDGMGAASEGRLEPEALEALFDDAVRDTLRRFEETGSPVVTDGEQRKPSFATYPIAGLTNLAPGGVTIPFADGHTRQLPVLTDGPFHACVVVPRPGTDDDEGDAEAGSDFRLCVEPAVPR